MPFTRYDDIYDECCRCVFCLENIIRHIAFCEYHNEKYDKSLKFRTIFFAYRLLYDYEDDEIFENTTLFP
jgi:hypothetical protein